jgi:hypothetical protein
MTGGKVSEMPVFRIGGACISNKQNSRTPADPDSYGENLYMLASQHGFGSRQRARRLKTYHDLPHTPHLRESLTAQVKGNLGLPSYSKSVQSLAVRREEREREIHGESGYTS